LLVGNAGVVAVLDFSNYVMRLDSSTLLIWNQGTQAKVHLHVIRPNLFPPFGNNLKTEVLRMERAGARLALPDSPVASMNLNTSVIDENTFATFPAELQNIDELLILCMSPAIAIQGGTRANLALLVAKPKQSGYQLYPQDWFHSADLDFGYQWVTRVARDPQTGRVHGEGFRISPFELDDTLHNLVDAS
jgi:hypothetical protein